MARQADPNFTHSHQLLIEQILRQEFQPSYLAVIDESYMHHSGPRAGTHYKVVIVADSFQGLSLINKQRRVNKALAPALEAGVHALSAKIYSPEEWVNNPQIIASPACAGKNTTLVGKPE